ncbi:hypothetical protein N7456_001846 [Penicillium angulare]|uniref:Uncharacterized protein n=1 Tax=Penicillium angulare TaxID=116970 RepID=A0A9W9KPP5_9EURO|nr:hypothetical protein N7456_001846 [Penicillium angulare]
MGRIEVLVLPRPKLGIHPSSGRPWVVQFQLSSDAVRDLKLKGIPTQSSTSTLIIHNRNESVSLSAPEMAITVGEFNDENFNNIVKEWFGNSYHSLDPQEHAILFLNILERQGFIIFDIDAWGLLEGIRGK